MLSNVLTKRKKRARYVLGPFRMIKMVKIREWYDISINLSRKSQDQKIYGILTMLYCIVNTCLKRLDFKMIEMIYVFIVIGIVLGTVSLALLLYAFHKIRAAQKMVHNSQEKIKLSKQHIENERREASLKLKDELYKRKKEFEVELKKDRVELDRLQSKINARSDVLDKKEEQLDDLRLELQQKERKIAQQEDLLRAEDLKCKNLHTTLTTRLERMAGMGREEAKRELFSMIESEVQLANQKIIHKIEEDARQIAKQKAIDITVTAMQRYTAEQVASNSSGMVNLPSEEMKGRIIGKEGRNIKSLEMATGMEFIIGESTDITISGFNPIRREIARRSLEKLIVDGRINPTRIEETVKHCEKEIDDNIEEYGKLTVTEFNLQGVNPEIVTLLGKLHFRTSFSQNVLMHCKEVALFSRMIAQELGLDGAIALRAGLLHDIGKAVTAEVEGPHALIGADIARRCGEQTIVVNAIAEHHEEVPFSSAYSLIVMIADAISASRPGARRETLSAYIKRLERLEEIANTFKGVKKAFALQAGRELRIIVEEDQLSDEESLLLARSIARKVEEEMNFPGQIKINVIREKRSIEYAR